MRYRRIRILLADDQQEMLATVARLLEVDFDVIATVENGKQAIEAAVLLNPDLLVLDISMPVLNGLEAACALKKAGFSAKVIFLTVNQDTYIVEMALAVGALGYVFKQRLAKDLIPAIRQVLDDRIFISPSTRVGNSLGEQPILTKG
jgi:DNA-binding NarL/FixJ family response regulator